MSSRLGRNIFTTYVARLSNIIAILFLFAWVESAVGAQAYGVYLLTASVAALFTFDLGMAGSTTRYVAAAFSKNAMADVRRITASSSVFFLIIGVVAAAATIGVIVLGWSAFDIPTSLRDEAAMATVFAAMQAFAGSAFSVNRHILSGAGRLDFSNAIQIAQLILRVALTLGVIQLGFGIVSVVVVDLIAAVLGGLVAWIARRRLIPQSIARMKEFDRDTFRKLFKLGADLLVLSVAALVILQTGNLIVSLFLPIAAVAAYGAGFRIYQASRELTNSLTSALLPFATHQHATGRLSQNQLLYTFGTKYANYLVIAVCVPLIVFAAPIITAWVGPDLAEGYPVAQILLISMVINNQHLVAVPILTAQANIRAFSLLHITWAVACILLGIGLTPLIGIAGMALATALPVVLLEPLYLAVLLKRLSIKWSVYFAQVFAPPFLVAILPAAALVIVAIVAIPQSLVGVISASFAWFAVYTAGFWVVGMRHDERLQITTLARRYWRRK